MVETLKNHGYPPPARIISTQAVIIVSTKMRRRALTKISKAFFIRRVQKRATVMLKHHGPLNPQFIPVSQDYLPAPSLPAGIGTVANKWLPDIVLLHRRADEDRPLGLH